MMQNPYPRTLRDDEAGIEVRGQNHIIWQNGYSAGFDDCLNAFDKNLKMVESLMDNGATRKQIIDKLVEATRAVKTQ
jgi:hypothetical protein